jgi:hypothetical protein
MAPTWVVLLGVTFVCGVLAPSGTAQRMSKTTVQKEADVRMPKNLTLLPPKNVQIEVSDQKAVLSWDTVPLARVTGYVVFVKSVESKQWTKLGISRKPPFLLDGIELGQELEFSVSALDRSGTVGGKSDPAAVSRK